MLRIVCLWGEDSMSETKQPMLVGEKDQVQGQCQWAECIVLSTKHVCFGARVFDGEPINGSLIPLEHRDLCDEHTDHVLRHYLRVHIMDLSQDRSRDAQS